MYQEGECDPDGTAGDETVRHVTAMDQFVLAGKSGDFDSSANAVKKLKDLMLLKLNSCITLHDSDIYQLTLKV